MFDLIRATADVLAQNTRPKMNSASAGTLAMICSSRKVKNRVRRILAAGVEET